MSKNIGSITIHASCDSEGKLVETLKSGDVLSKAQDGGFCIDEDWSIEDITSLGAYPIYNRVRDQNIRVWIVKKDGNGRDPHKPLLKSGGKEDTHYFVSSKNGGMVRTSRDDVRAHVTNEINLANMGGDYIEDIGLRCDPLERFFKHAKTGDHTEFDVGPSGNKMMVRVIRLRNEVD